MLSRIHAWATAAWLGLIGGAGLGFITRDLLDLGQTEVAFSWFAGAALGLAWASRGLRDRLCVTADRRPGATRCEGPPIHGSPMDPQQSKEGWRP